MWPLNRPLFEAGKMDKTAFRDITDRTKQGTTIGDAKRLCSVHVYCYIQPRTTRLPRMIAAS